MHNLMEGMTLTTPLALILLLVAAMTFGSCGLLIGAILTFGRVGSLENKIIALERIVANQTHVIDCLKSALEGALDFISHNSPAGSNYAKNLALALEVEASKIPYAVTE